MNIYALLTILSGIGAIVTFVCGVKSMLRFGQFRHRSTAEWMTWHFVFEVAVFATILMAPLAKA